MSFGNAGKAIEQFRATTLLGAGEGTTDGQLLERFVAGGDADAFEAILHRHGPVVLGVCRRILGNAHDAEDAFQATFLVLARKAASVVPADAVGGWLHGVAYRTARKARAAAARRQMKEKPMKDVPDPAAAPDPSWQELAPLLDAELSRLPERYRLAVLLCDVEGRTRREVARQLNLPDGTLSNRLTKGREILARHLSRRGVALTAASVTVLLSQGAALAVPASLVKSTATAAVSVAAGATLVAVVSSEVAALTEGVLRSMAFKKVGIVTAALLVVVAAGTAGGLVWRAHAAERAGQGTEVRVMAEDEPEPKGGEKAVKEELKNLQGTWYVVGGAYLGKADPDQDIRDVLKRGQWQKLEITGDKFVWGSVLKEDAMKGTIKIDPRKKPMTLDLTFERDGKTVTGRCIFERTGNKMKLCYNEPDRPKKFETSADAKNQKLYVWERLKR